MVRNHKFTVSLRNEKIECIHVSCFHASEIFDARHFLARGLKDLFHIFGNALIQFLVEG